MPRKKSNELNDIVLKFTNRPNILNNFLGSQKYVFNKRGISYKPNLKQKYYKSYFVKAISINDQIVCHYCNRNDHINYRCPIKRNAYYGIKCIWFKDLRFILYGSKKKKNKWHLNSGCSRHMTDNYSLL